MKFYLTAAIPYVNAKPHLGHALEFVEGDVVARYQRKKGDEVFYISGADENSLKNVRAAEEEGISVQELCDRNAKAFKELAKLYDVKFDAFGRSSSPAHFASSQDLWKRCAAAGDIYKKKYKGLYCVGCEQFYTRDELNEKGECFEHPGRLLEEVEEENYFFKLSKYENEIKELIETGTYTITPEHRKNEALGFLRQGLKDFSISRSKERAHGWGVSVPDDPEQIMYVWFDALNVYRSTAPEWWPASLHIIGKGILRFHAIYWPAILLSAKVSLPKELFVHGYITVDGAKMSKTIGNVVDPAELAKKYGADAVRYYLLREIPSDGDGDFSEEKCRARYNADLANGIGNFTARVLTLAKKALIAEGKASANIIEEIANARRSVGKCIEARKLHVALEAILELISLGDRFINEKKPWALSDTAERKAVLENCLAILDAAAEELAPFLPHISKAILARPQEPLFPRI